ncbi:hypothetical protein BVC80_1653g69 [Macleaya cordata]|uniref:Uncharacterized protein n=1 Tax=Macleaya cordata TaxID=56857 RepID=A0A200PST9_MACCD|nr:hypothetical protein BVC80_1653g69 [Macleaya cordata]
MNKSTRTPSELLLIFLFISLELVIIISPLFISTINADHHDGGDQQNNLKNKQNPNAAERAIGITTHVTPWMTIRSWLKLAWMNIRPTDSQAINREASNSGELMKEAVSKSFETSKETAKKTAKVAGDAIHKTAEKVIKKTTVSNTATGKSSMDNNNNNQQEL